MKRVVIHIDSLVLKGFRHEDRHAIAEGLQQELSRLLANPRAVESLTGLGDQLRLKVSGVHIARGTKPQRVGAQVAQGIGREFKA
ncbi:MAG: hypothetical protein ACSLE5_13200 [Porticoccaceae bacterium]